MCQEDGFGAHRRERKQWHTEFASVALERWSKEFLSAETPSITEHIFLRKRGNSVPGICISFHSSRHPENLIQICGSDRTSGGTRLGYSPLI